ncbi:uncharacterized protein BX663DRAFT_485130 [Cokeromyces recurvatus]|uniref:uncharacterized protein n=1 Tax=Cokeromyces recurvatus TaxID=90255 RepID=UPI00221F2A9C|nr:uncharacterized protein BX663DRAFT_485130 [Cokeromyces recurvatus]KAI7904304.1 hypothetical protein BX663DRAFT_485130 [Cokeromyces recurvatus]
MAAESDVNPLLITLSIFPGTNLVKKMLLCEEGIKEIIINKVTDGKMNGIAYDIGQKEFKVGREKKIKRYAEDGFEYTSKKLKIIRDETITVTPVGKVIITDLYFTIKLREKPGKFFLGGVLRKRKKSRFVQPLRVRINIERCLSKEHLRKFHTIKKVILKIKGNLDMTKVMFYHIAYVSYVPYVPRVGGGRSIRSVTKTNSFNYALPWKALHLLDLLFM